MLRCPTRPSHGPWPQAAPTAPRAGGLDSGDTGHTLQRRHTHARTHARTGGARCRHDANWLQRAQDRDRPASASACISTCWPSIGTVTHTHTYCTVLYEECTHARCGHAGDTAGCCCYSFPFLRVQKSSRFFSMSHACLTQPFGDTGGDGSWMHHHQQAACCIARLLRSSPLLTSTDEYYY